MNELNDCKKKGMKSSLVSQFQVSQKILFYFNLQSFGFFLFRVILSST